MSADGGDNGLPKFIFIYNTQRRLQESSIRGLFIHFSFFHVVVLSPVCIFWLMDGVMSDLRH